MGDETENEFPDDVLLSMNNPSLSYVSLVRVIYSLLRCGTIESRKTTAMNLIAKPILLRRLIKKIFGDHAFKYRSKRTQSSSSGDGTSNGGANLFRIHLLEGHLGTKFMSCLS